MAKRFGARDLVILGIDAGPLACWLESRIIPAAPMEHCSDRVLRRDPAFRTTAAHIAGTSSVSLPRTLRLLFGRSDGG